MARTPSSTKSESVTLRIPDEIFSQVLNYATAKTKGNRSEAIVELIEMGLAVFIAQQSNQPGLTPQDIERQREVNETVKVLTDQVYQLTYLVQDTVLQRLTALENQVEVVSGEFHA